jgi:ribonuclease E
MAPGVIGGEPTAEVAEGGAPERDGRRRRRRGGRGRGREETTGAATQTAVEGAEAGVTPAPVEAEAPIAFEQPAAAVREHGPAVEAGGRRRGRDRFRRERRDEQAEGETLAASIVDEAAEQVEHAAPVAAAAAAAAAPQLPAVVEPFVLPVDDLRAVAEGSGLQWVMSDAEKIAAVQAAMDAEPEPIRVPRERRPMVVVDEGPLVLVETRKDLAQLKLPFEQTPAP